LELYQRFSTMLRFLMEQAFKLSSEVLIRPKQSCETMGVIAASSVLQFRFYST